MNTIALTGLVGDSPIAFMAAVGLLRVVEESRAFGEVALGWTVCGARWQARLDTSEAISDEAILTFLADRMKGAAGRKEFVWSRAVDSKVIQPFLNEAVRDRALGDWATAFAAPSASDWRRTTFDTTTANQGLLSTAVKLASALAPPSKKSRERNPRDRFQEALFGPWRYEDDYSSLGWDPQSSRLGAYTIEAPTTMKQRSVIAAVWLAIESLPLFPVFTTGRRVETTGFVYERKKREFRWPLWTAALNLDEVRSLVAHLDDLISLRRRGVACICSCERIEPEDRYGMFTPSRLVPWD